MQDYNNDEHNNEGIRRNAFNKTRISKSMKRVLDIVCRIFWSFHVDKSIYHA